MNSTKPVLQGLLLLAFTCRVLHANRCCKQSSQPAHLSCPSGRLEFDQPVPLTRHLTSATSGVPQLTPIGFLPLRRFNWLNPLSPGLPHPVRSAYRLFQPPSGLLLCQSGDPVSCLLRPWGSTQEASPHVNPCSFRSRSPLAVG